jgi:hypothetical protein
MLTFKKFMAESVDNCLAESIELLYEKLVVFNGGAKYGQIVFMSGGAGSGKGFASSSFMESEKFKIRDVDEWKKAYLALAKLKDKFPEIRSLNLKNSDDVFTLHKFVKKKGIKDRTLDLLLNDARADRLPNIIFDITGKDISDFQDSIPKLEDAGYEAKNIHVAWVLTDYKVAYVANLTRDRVVPADVFLDTHQGAGSTMGNLLDAKKMPRGANGRFVVIMNNRNNTIMFKGGEKYKGRTVPENAKGVKSFYYITVKDAGKPFRSEDKWKQELHNQIVANIPGGQDTIETLRQHALETLSGEVVDKTSKGEDASKEMSGLDIVRADIKKDKEEKNKPK